MATWSARAALALACLVLMHAAHAHVLRGNAGALAELPTFPNIKYLGLGYNVVTGNPFTNGADPGFAPETRQQMLKLTYNEGRQYDNQYAVPDGMNVINDASCSYSTASHTSTSASDYQKTLQTQMSFSASADMWFGNFEFSASAEYQSFVSSNEKQDMVQVSATAHCTAYGADLDAFGWKPTFTDEFQGAVRALGESLEYGEFTKLFGTHYVMGMQMGGSSTYAATMKSSSLAEMKRTGVDVSVGASLSFFDKVGADVSHSSKVSDYKAFSAAVSSDTLSGIPEPAPQCGGSMCSDYSAWSAAVTTDPQPVNIKLVSIVELLTPTYFPNDGNITMKAAALTSFLANQYCGTVPHCAPAPPPDVSGIICNNDDGCCTLAKVASSDQDATSLACTFPSGAIVTTNSNDTQWCRGVAPWLQYKNSASSVSFQLCMAPRSDDGFIQPITSSGGQGHDDDSPVVNQTSANTFKICDGTWGCCLVTLDSTGQGACQLAGPEGIRWPHIQRQGCGGSFMYTLYKTSASPGSYYFFQFCLTPTQGPSGTYWFNNLRALHTPGPTSQQTQLQQSWSFRTVG